jgi:hypothetical protein
LFRIKLRVGAARGRLCTAFLVIPRRKTALVRAFHWRWQWPDLSSLGGAHGGSSKRKGGGRRDGGGGARLLGALGGHGEGLLLEELDPVRGCSRAVRDEEEIEEREEKEKR